MTRWLAIALLALAPMPVKATLKADRVVIDKTSRTMTMLAGRRELATFAVALGRLPGRKECEGDRRTPEGIYVVSGRNVRSAYHRSLRLSYPSAEDAAAARTKGCPPGSDIMIHGLPNGFGWIGRLHAETDWTRGCIAVTNEEIERVWELVPDGTIVEIKR